MCKVIGFLGACLQIWWRRYRYGRIVRRADKRQQREEAEMMRGFARYQRSKTDCPFPPEPPLTWTSEVPHQCEESPAAPHPSRT